MKNLLYLSLFFVVSAKSQIQSSSFIQSGFAASEQFTDAFSFCRNTAALASISKLSAGIIAEKRFMMNELRQYLAAISKPVQKGGIGMMAAYNGFSHFNSSQVGLAYGKSLGKVSLGAQFNYHRVSTAGYGSDAAIAIDIGSTWQVAKKVYTGIQLNNVIGGKYKNSDEKLGRLYTLSIGYEPSAHSLFQASVIKEEDKPVIVCAGMQYIVGKKLYTRFSISTVTASPFFSVGWKWKNCRADITASYHPQLGFSPGLVLQFFGKEREEKL